jgi:hypothetical protein
MPRLPWIFVAVGLCLLAILQPAILLPFLLPGFLLLAALRQFLPSDVFYSIGSIDPSGDPSLEFLGFLVLSSALFWMMLTFVIRWRSRRPVISFLMRLTGTRIGLIAAALNVLVFVLLLMTREPAYERLAELDAFTRSGTTGDISSAEPMYLAGRPFYSTAHYGDVALAESLFFMANLPAYLGAFLVVQAVDEVPYYFEAYSMAYVMSSAQRSWVTAVCFMTFAALWAFFVGAVSHRFVRWVGRDRQGDRRPDTTPLASP